MCLQSLACSPCSNLCLELCPHTRCSLHIAVTVWESHQTKCAQMNIFSPPFPSNSDVALMALLSGPTPGLGTLVIGLDVFLSLVTSVLLLLCTLHRGLPLSLDIQATFPVSFTISCSFICILMIMQSNNAIYLIRLF